MNYETSTKMHIFFVGNPILLMLDTIQNVQEKTQKQ